MSRKLKRSRSRNRVRQSKSRRIIITQSERKKRPKDDMDLLNDTFLNLDIHAKKHRIPPTRDFVTLYDCKAYIYENYPDIYELLIDRNRNFKPILLRSYLTKQHIKHIPTSLEECCHLLNLIEEQKLMV
jgi:hypothetical protein